MLLTMRQTQTPEGIRSGVLALVDAVLAAAEAWFAVARELPSLQEASFAGPEVQRVLKRIQEISDLEWEADKQQAAVSKEVFRREEELGAVSVMFWANILRVLGAVAAGAIGVAIKHGDEESAAASYSEAHEKLYRGRLWVNRIARTAVLSPQLSSMLLRAGAFRPALLRTLTAKLVRPG